MNHDLDFVSLSDSCRIPMSTVKGMTSKLNNNLGRTYVLYMDHAMTGYIPLEPCNPAPINAYRVRGASWSLSDMRTGGRRSPVVACWASDHWVASSNPLRGKFRH